MRVSVALCKLYYERKVTELKNFLLALEELLHLMLDNQILLNALQRISFLSFLILDEEDLAHLSLAQLAQDI